MQSRGVVGASLNYPCRRAIVPVPGFMLRADRFHPNVHVDA